MSPNELSPSPNTTFRPATFEVDPAGRVKIGGMDVLNLAERFGTPLYVLDEATIRQMAAAYRDTLQTQYPEAFLPLYAAKANLTMGLCRLMAQEGFGLDVVSGGELYTALQAGFPMENVYFNSNNKSIEELELAIHHQVGLIGVDNFYELALIDEIAGRKGVTVDALLRIAPGIECHTHDYIKTGQTDTKFGFDMTVLSRAVEQIMGQYKDTIRLKGLHAHIGSQIFETRPYEDLVQFMMNVYYNIRETYDGLTLSVLNIGGGYGIQYTSEDDPPNVPQTLVRVVDKLKNYADQLNYPLPRLLLEPGRSMIATAGVTLYTVGSTKEVPRLRKYVAVDGGMGDNIRPALYQAGYSAVIANKIKEPAEETVRIVGKYCESGDVLIDSLAVPKVEQGDTLMVFGTGAYNYSMASNYNRIPRPATVLVENGKAHVLVKRETYEDVAARDLIPAHLAETRSNMNFAASEEKPAMPVGNPPETETSAPEESSGETAADDAETEAEAPVSTT